jgi:hemoglobin
MKTDIRNRKDIELLVNAFYDKIKTDGVIGFLFTEVAKVNWETHLPRMYDFWENILFLPETTTEVRCKCTKTYTVNAL